MALGLSFFGGPWGAEGAGGLLLELLEDFLLFFGEARGCWAGSPGLLGGGQGGGEWAAVEAGPDCAGRAGEVLHVGRCGCVEEAERPVCALGVSE